MSISKYDIVRVHQEWLSQDPYDVHQEVVSICNANGFSMNMGTSWCAATWCAAILKATENNTGERSLFPFSLACGPLASQAASKGIWVENNEYIPDPGDGVIYDWSDTPQYKYDHVGTVISVSGRGVTVAEGNMGSYPGTYGTRSYTVGWGEIRGYILPKYTDRDYTKPVPPVDHVNSGSGGSSSSRGSGGGYGGGSGTGRRGSYNYSRNMSLSGANAYKGKPDSFGVASGIVDKFLQKGVYSTWYRISLGGLNLSSGNSSNIFVSFEYNKNGSGQANTFTLNLAYVPKPGGDPNAIDKALILDESDTEGCQVKMQYGYTNGPASPIYVGLALDYSVEIRDGMLYYTITGYSGLVREIVEKRTYDQIGVDDDESTWEHPTIVAVKAFEDAGMNVEYYVKYPDEKVHIPARYDVTVFEYVNDLLLSAKYVSDDPNELNKRVLYDYYIDDSRDVVIIRSFSPDDDTEPSTYTFNWMSKENNMVIDFRPDFKGSIALSYNVAKEKNLTQNFLTRFGIPTSAEAVDDLNTGDTNTEIYKGAATWALAVQTPYTATLTTIGVPCEAPIGEIIEINPLIYGRKHHTAGRYMITGTRDIIDANGYQTVVSLMKVTT